MMVLKYLASTSIVEQCDIGGGKGKSEIERYWNEVAVKNSSITTKHLYHILTFPSHHEIFIRISWYSGGSRKLHISARKVVEL